MFSNLKGGPLVAIAVVVLGIIGGATALVWNGSLSGSDWLVVVTPILTAATGVTTAHVVGNAMSASTLSPSAGGSTPTAGNLAPAGGPVGSTSNSTVSLPAQTI
jgi:hypothetical protein